MCTCSWERKMKGEKAPRYYFKKTVGCVHSCLKYHVFCLITVYYLLLQLLSVQGCTFCRSYSRHWCFCWCVVKVMLHFVSGLIHTFQNTTKQNLTILSCVFTYKSDPVIKSASVQKCFRAKVILRQKVSFRAFPTLTYSNNDNQI